SGGLGGSALATFSLGCGVGGAAFGFGTGALGRSFTTRSGSFGPGVGWGTGGATLRSTRGSTRIGGSFGRGVVFGASSAPGGRRMVICLRARSISACVGTC